MGKLADKYNKPKEPKPPKPPKEPKIRKNSKRLRIAKEREAIQSRMNADGTITETPDYTPEQLALRDQWIAKQLFYATHGHDIIQRTCGWCLTIYPNSMQLTLGNKYHRYAYDTKECQRNDALWRGWITSQEQEVKLDVSEE